MNIVLTGASGQLGSFLKDEIQKRFPLAKLTTPSHKDLLARPIHEVLNASHCNLLINAAAYTQVDQAEEETELAFRGNAELPLKLADYCKKGKIPLIHFSTDYVFDGNAPDGYDELAPARPISVYGQSKLAGDENIQGAEAAYLIFRICWVYSERKANFFLTMQRLFGGEKAPRIVADQVGHPSYAGAIARSIMDIVGTEWQHAQDHDDFYDRMFNQSGIYHWASDDSCSWFDFAQSIAKRSHPLKENTIEAIRSVDYPTAANRPKFSILKNEKIKQSFSIKIPNWEIQLDECFSNYKTDLR